MIDWKYIIIGAALVVVLGKVLRVVEYGTFTGVFISGIIVGYLVNSGYKNGAKNGIIAGIIGGFILGIIIYIRLAMYPPALQGWYFNLFVSVGGLSNAVWSGILVGVGGIIGSLIRDKI